MLDLGATHEVVEKSGSWFSYAGERLGQGRDNARLFLKEHTDIRDKLDLAVRQKLGLIGNATGEAHGSGSRV